MLLLLLTNAHAADETILTPPSPSWLASSGWALSAGGDANGDGADDLVVGSFLGTVDLYYGSATGLASPTTIDSTDTSGPYAFGSLGGDLDGDGLDDLVVAAGPTVDIFLGDPAGVDPAAPLTVILSDPGDDPIFGLARGDLDGDGDDDLVTDGYGHVTWFPGETGGVGTAQTLAASDGAATFGGAVGGAGDTDGDGCDDLVVGYDSGRAWLLSGCDALDELTLSAPDGSAEATFGWGVAGGGDVDADGYSEVLVATNADVAWLFSGGATGLDVAGGTALHPGDGSSGESFGLTVGGGFDADGDGFDDVLVGADEASVDGVASGAAWLFRGGPDGLDAGERLVPSDGADADYFGVAVAGGDLDGDAVDEVLVGAFGKDVDGAPSAGGVYRYDLPASDDDGDGWITAEDCDDADPAVYPGAPETNCEDPVDYNCDGSAGLEDADGDGTVACEDCDDADTGRGPGAAEVCDGIDNDCDGLLDDEDPDRTGGTTFYVDADGDGYGGAGTVSACAVSVGTTATSDDCDDTNAALHPGATETCDEIDNDCDGLVDDDDRDVSPPMSWYDDKDGDGYGGTGMTACVAPPGASTTKEDCDDATATVHPGATETCDHQDEDCDGLVDADDPDVTGMTTFYVDADGDDYGGDTTTLACFRVEGLTVGSSDCDDTDPAISPVATEVCNDVDDDCDELVDDEDGDVEGQTTWYADEDGDGWPGTEVQACDMPEGGGTEATDCDDQHATVNPGAQEICDGTNTDQDCDGLVDTEDPDSDKNTFYRDFDADGYGGTLETIEACARPDGYYATADDCDDTNSAVNPGMTEVCDLLGIDEDCDGVPNGEDAQGRKEFCADRDGDGYGSTGERMTACDAEDGWVSDCSDCNDVDPDIPEYYDFLAGDECNGVDEDCDGEVDEDCVEFTGDGALCGGCGDDGDGGGACTAAFAGLALFLGGGLRRRRSSAAPPSRRQPVQTER